MSEEIKDVVQAAVGDAPAGDAPVRKKDKYRMPKPWDNDPTIDKFKEEEFKPEYNTNGLLEESSFAVLFP